MGKPRPPDDDPTLEEEVPEFDGSVTDQLDDSYRLSVVSSSEDSAGRVDHDDRGTSRWKWKTESGDAPVDADGTFDHLKALNNPTLTVEGEEAPVPDEGSARAKGPGYDPYAAPPTVRKPTRKP